MSEGHPEEIPLDQIPESGLEKLIGTLGQDDPGELQDVLRPVPAPSFGSLADPGSPTEPPASVWDQTEAEGSPPVFRPDPPDDRPVIDWERKGVEDPILSDPGVQERLSRLRRPEDVAESIGADLGPVPNNPLQRVWGRARGKQMASAPVEMDPPSEFAKLLTPLSGSEVALLEKEVQADEVIFVRMERVRADASLRQNLGLLIGILVVALFLLSAGESYLVDVLPSASIPSWVPDSDIAQQIAGGTLFALGLILPFVLVYVFAEAARLLLWAIGDRSPWLGAAGALHALAGVLAMNFTIRGEIPAAVMVLLLYAFLSELERKLRPGRGS